MPTPMSFITMLMRCASFLAGARNSERHLEVTPKLTHEVDCDAGMHASPPVIEDGGRGQQIYRLLPDNRVNVNAKSSIAVKRDERRAIAWAEDLAPVGMIIRLVRIDSAGVCGFAVLCCRGRINILPCDVTAARGAIGRVLDLAAPLHHKEILDNAAFVARAGDDGPPARLRPGHDRSAGFRVIPYDGATGRRDPAAPAAYSRGAAAS